MGRRVENPLRPESTLWRTLNSLTDLFVLNFLWVLCCLPVVTIGGATTALYDSVVHCVRGGESGAYSRFFRTFRNEWKSGALQTLLWAGILGFAWFILQTLNQAGESSNQASIVAQAWWVTFIFLVGGACWVGPILSRYTFGFKELTGACFKIIFAHPFVTLILGGITTLVLGVSVTYIVPLLLTPSPMVLLWTALVEPAFREHSGKTL